MEAETNNNTNILSSRVKFESQEKDKEVRLSMPLWRRGEKGVNLSARLELLMPQSRPRLSDAFLKFRGRPGIVVWSRTKLRPGFPSLEKRNIIADALLDSLAAAMSTTNFGPDDFPSHNEFFTTFMQ